MAILPKSLQLIADYCGEDVMWAVWKHYSGIHLSIPQRVDGDHELTQTLGIVYAMRLCKVLGGETIGYIAKFDQTQKAEIAARNQNIQQQRQQGYSLARLARLYDLSERQIQNILKADNEVIPQGDLFS